MKKVRIGGGQGFWGDSDDAAIHMVETDSVDYIACDYLAELTLSIMQRQKMKNPGLGYAKDFVRLFRSIGESSYRRGIRLVTNAGGMNISSLVSEIKTIAEQKKMKGYRIGYVTGDDVLNQVKRLYAEGMEFPNLDDSDLGGGFEDVLQNVVNANVYYGHEPIVSCLQENADVVITGRASDSAMFLAPLMYELGWKQGDLDAMARGIMAGHLLECGGQGAGGNFQYDWRHVPDMDRLGFPIAVVSGEELMITKAPDCGGLISEQSLKEQILYEVHDPCNYYTPDVTVDIGKVCLTQNGENCVRVSGIYGKPRPEKLKLSLGYHAGYKAVAYLSFAWPDAVEKAQFTADLLMKKLKRKGMRAEEVRIDFVGLNALHLSVAEFNEDMKKNLNEVLLRIAIRTKSKEDAEKMIPEIAPMQLNGPPGASFFGGRAKVQEVIALWPALIPRDEVNLKADVIEVK